MTRAPYLNGPRLQLLEDMACHPVDPNTMHPRWDHYINALIKMGLAKKASPTLDLVVLTEEGWNEAQRRKLI